jgi:hypothetical protein
MNESEFVLIVGCPRSGTYLLQTRLTEQSDLSMPVETHFIPLFARFLPLWGPLSDRNNRQRLLMAIYSFLKIWTPRSERERDYNKVFAESLLITQESQAEIIANSYDYPSLIRELFRTFSDLKGNQRFGDKSAFYANQPLDRLFTFTQPTKVVHIIRDPRDVALSWMQIFTGPHTLLECARQWNHHVSENRAWGKKHPDHYFEIKYEEYLSDPETIKHQVSQFLGLKTVIESNSNLSGILAKGNMHSLIAGPILGSNSAWKSRLTQAELAMFERVCGQNLDALEYERNSGKAINSIVFSLLALTSRFLHLVSPRTLKRGVKTLLPIIIWVNQKTGVFFRVIP